VENTDLIGCLRVTGSCELESKKLKGMKIDNANRKIAILPLDMLCGLDAVENLREEDALKFLSKFSYGASDDSIKNLEGNFQCHLNDLMSSSERRISNCLYLNGRDEFVDSAWIACCNGGGYLYGFSVWGRKCIDLAYDVFSNFDCRRFSIKLSNPPPIRYDDFLDQSNLLENELRKWFDF
jgi:hypothetical protein